MSQSQGASRIVHNINEQQASQGDARLIQQLQLYKTPAIIRDMKTVFFYMNVFANSTTVNPVRLFDNYNKTFLDPALVPITMNDVPNYYLPVGTKRRFNIGEQVNSLLDLTIPKDKYFLEINLVECQIEADPSNWTKIPNNTIIPRPNPDELVVADTFDLEYVLQPDPDPYPAPPTAIPKVNLAGPIFRRATKKTIPQPLFVRIPQLCNGEPYNWSVVNNGETNLDKSHLLVVRHGDINYQELDVEFGHLVFTGRDNEYIDKGTGVIDRARPADFDHEYFPSATSGNNSTFTGNKAAEQDIKFYNKFEYLDYNSEWNNNSILNATQNNVNPEYNIPANRSTGYAVQESVIDPARTSSAQVILASTPLKTNQQVSSIMMRFSLKLIHLF